MTKFYEAVVRNKNTGLQEEYLLAAESEGDVADHLIQEGKSYCGEGNFSYDFEETTKKNRKFKSI
jgi:hypothetical protein